MNVLSLWLKRRMYLLLRHRIPVLMVVLLVALLTQWYALMKIRSTSWGTDEAVDQVQWLGQSAPRIQEVAACFSRDSAIFPYSLVIIVFTYSRLDGLRRLLQSLVEADYLGRRDVELRVFFDYKKTEKSTSQATLQQFLESFVWPHGRFTLHKRIRNAGLKVSIVESWYPIANNEVAAFFEDDLEVSPLWYVWADRAIQKYVFAWANSTRESADQSYGANPEPSPTGHVVYKRHSRLIGLSLYRPIVDELSRKVVRSPSSSFQPFLLQQPSSWGAIYFATPWRIFRNWFEAHEKDGGLIVDPTRPLLVPASNGWADETSWKKFLLKLMYAKGWFMIYPNFPARMVLSTNHFLKGEHKTPPRKLFQLPLVPAGDTLNRAGGGMNGAPAVAPQRDINVAMNSFPPLSQMNVFDLMFTRVSSLESLLNDRHASKSDGSRNSTHHL